MWRTYKPEWLYELLPFLYVGVGVMTILMLRNPVAAVSGMLLISAGVVVWSMRRNYRNGRELAAVHASANGPLAARASPVLAELAWRDAFDTGHPAIDTQHRNLFLLGNKLIDSMTDHRPAADIELMLSELLGAFERHCEKEAAHLAAAGDPVDAQQRDKLARTLARARALEERYQLGEVPISALIGFVTYDTIVQHVMDGPHRRREISRASASVASPGMNA